MTSYFALHINVRHNSILFFRFILPVRCHRRLQLIFPVRLHSQSTLRLSFFFLHLHVCHVRCVCVINFILSDTPRIGGIHVPRTTNRRDLFPLPSRWSLSALDALPFTGSPPSLPFAVHDRLTCLTRALAHKNQYVHVCRKFSLYYFDLLCPTDRSLQISSSSGCIHIYIYSISSPLCALHFTPSMYPNTPSFSCMSYTFVNHCSL